MVILKFFLFKSLKFLKENVCIYWTIHRNGLFFFLSYDINVVIFYCFKVNYRVGF